MTRDVSRPPKLKFEGTDLNGLLPLLQWLDVGLEQALASHPYDHESVEARSHSLPQPGSKNATALSGNSAFDKDATSSQSSPSLDGLDSLQLREGTPIAWLRDTFALSLLELKIIIIALAPELDRRYDKCYAYLQNDARCQRPTVDVALGLICTTSLDRLEQRCMFANDGPLLHNQLLHLMPGAEGGRPTLLGQEMHLAESVVQLLLGQSGLASSLSRHCRWQWPSNPLDTFPLQESDGLERLLLTEWEAHRPLRLYVQGTDHERIHNLVMALATRLQIPVISADISALVREKVALEPLLKSMLRSAWFQTALLFLENLDRLQAPEQQHFYPQIWETIAEHSGLTVLSGSEPYRVNPHNRVGVVTVPLPRLTVERRRDCWQEQLEAAGIELEAAELEQLCARYQLTSSQIANGVETACKLAQWQGNSPVLQDFLAAARAQSGHDLATHGQKVEPRYAWDDIVLPADTKSLLKQLCNQAKYRHQVQEIWGFGQKLSLGRGLTALFAGPPGTGKTMAAEVIAHELGLDLYKIDLSQVVSKYIGETEKSLNRIFRAAINANAVLLFDEADALFSKRTEVKDAHDRYANLETSYLLQKMEEYEGIAILTTNLQSNMDEAFVRRLQFIVAFPMPGLAERQQIWQQIWPEPLPLAQDVDLEFLAERLEISGAVIRNIALGAAYLAAGATEEVGMAQIMPAVRREYQKMGRILMGDDLKPYNNLY